MILNIINNMVKKVETISVYPSLKGTLTYNGSAQSPAWNNYDSSKMSLSVASQVNAGSYKAVFTPLKGYCWSNGKQDPYTVTWTIERKSTAKPTIRSNPTYNGSAQAPSWNSYEAAAFSVSGTASATNAGSYSVTFTPNSNYKWSDGSTGAYTVNWQIYKTAGSVWLSASNGTINPGTAQISFTVGSNSGAGISVSSSNTGAVSTWNSGYTVYCKKNGSGHGDSTITVNLSESTNYTGASTTYTCYARTHWDNDLYNHGWRSGDLTLINTDEHFAVYHYFPEESDTAWMNNWNGTIQLYCNSSGKGYSVYLIDYNSNDKGKIIHVNFTTVNGAGGYIYFGNSKSPSASTKSININTGEVSGYIRYSSQGTASSIIFNFYGETTIVIDRIWITD
jgi:hypothetical protein